MLPALSKFLFVAKDTTESGSVTINMVAQLKEIIQVSISTLSLCNLSTFPFLIVSLHCLPQPSVHPSCSFHGFCEADHSTVNVTFATFTGNGIHVLQAKGK